MKLYFNEVFFMVNPNESVPVPIDNDQNECKKSDDDRENAVKLVEPFDRHHIICEIVL